MKYRVTNIRPLMHKLRRNGLFAVDSEVNPDVVYVIDRGEIGIVNRIKKEKLIESREDRD